MQKETKHEKRKLIDSLASIHQAKDKAQVLNRLLSQAWDESLSWSRFSDRKVPLNKVETNLINQAILMLSA